MSLLSSHYSEADSRPALTRESTAYGTESTLPTPLDEPSLGPRLKPRGPNLTRNAGSRCLHIDTARVHTPSQDDDGYSSNAAPLDTTDSYFALTTRPPPSPIRRNTAKDLINQFENISSRPQAKFRQSVAPSAGSIVRRESPLPDIPPPLSELRSKSKNTLRASFRSIISIFGKRGKGKQADELLIGTRYEEASQGHPSPVVISTPRLQPSPPPMSIESTVVRSGPLLYLSRPISGGALPVWTNCSASLSSAQILLEWNTSYGNPCSRIIMLKGSNNVRSLSKPEVDPTEKSLLPDTNRDAYVFEVTYDCSESERFAMNSVAERSAWVSAIWDALLQLGSQCEDQEVRPSEEIREHFDESKNETPLHLDDEMESGKYLKPPFVTSTSYLRESLPSLPDEVDEVVLLPLSRRSSVLQQNSELMRSISKSTTTPTNTNLGVQLYKLKTSSSSVQNLDNLSVVQRRLSQLSDDKEINVDLSHKPTQISIGREGSVASKYSVMSEEQCGRPFILEASHLNALNDMAARRNIDQQCEQASGHGDDQSIFDLYTDKMTTNKPLSPILDESEVQTTESPLIISELHELEESTKAAYDLGYSAARTESTSNDGQVVNSPSLVALIQDHAVQQFSQTSDLTHHVITLKNDFNTMSKDLRGVLSEQVPGSEVRRVLEDLCIKVDLIGGQVQLLKESDITKQQIDVNGDDTLHTTRTRIAGAHHDEDDTLKLSGFSETLDRVEERLGKDLPGILDLLGSLQKSGTDEAMQNIQAKIEELVQLAKVEKSAETMSSTSNPVLMSDIPKPPETSVSAPISDRNSASYLLIDILLKSNTEKHPEDEVDPCKEEIGKKVTIYSLTILYVLKRVLARGGTVASSERYRAEEDPDRTAK